MAAIGTAVVGLISATGPVATVAKGAALAAAAAGVSALFQKKPPVPKTFQVPKVREEQHQLAPFQETGMQVVKDAPRFFTFGRVRLNGICVYNQNGKALVYLGDQPRPGGQNNQTFTYSNASIVDMDPESNNNAYAISQYPGREYEFQPMAGAYLNDSSSPQRNHVFVNFNMVAFTSNIPSQKPTFLIKNLSYLDNYYEPGLTGVPIPPPQEPDHIDLIYHYLWRLWEAPAPQLKDRIEGQFTVDYTNLPVQRRTSWRAGPGVVYPPKSTRATYPSRFTYTRARYNNPISVRNDIQEPQQWIATSMPIKVRGGRYAAYVPNWWDEDRSFRKFPYINNLEYVKREDRQHVYEFQMAIPRPDTPTAGQGWGSRYYKDFGPNQLDGDDFAYDRLHHSQTPNGVIYSTDNIREKVLDMAEDGLLLVGESHDGELVISSINAPAQVNKEFYFYELTLDSTMNLELKKDSDDQVYKGISYSYAGLSKPGELLAWKVGTSPYFKTSFPYTVDSKVAKKKAELLLDQLKLGRTLTITTAKVLALDTKRGQLNSAGAIHSVVSAGEGTEPNPMNLLGGLIRINTDDIAYKSLWRVDAVSLDMDNLLFRITLKEMLKLTNEVYPELVPDGGYPRPILRRRPNTDDFYVVKPLEEGKPMNITHLHLYMREDRVTKKLAFPHPTIDLNVLDLFPTVEAGKVYTLELWYSSPFSIGPKRVVSVIPLDAGDGVRKWTMGTWGEGTWDEL